MMQSDRPTNSKQWQDSTDGWVRAMNISKEKKAAARKDVCEHDDLEWCVVCQYDENGEAYDI